MRVLAWRGLAGLARPGGMRSPVTQETVSPRGGSQAVRAARRDEAALLHRQGQGLGTQMLQEVLARADTDGVPAYLESSNERNLPLYERNGFRVIGELQALGHGPTIWRMWREPRPAPEGLVPVGPRSSANAALPSMEAGQGFPRNTATSSPAASRTVCRDHRLSVGQDRRSCRISVPVSSGNSSAALP
jgi:GNAT superfamily N-acetyltransferase